MKKALLLLLTLCLVLSFAACGNNEATEDTADDLATAVEIMSDPLYDLDASQYTEAEMTFEGDEGDTFVSGYTDNNGLMNVCVFTTEKNGQTLEDYVNAKADEFGGCTAFSDFYGTTLGLCGVLIDRDGVKTYNKFYTIDDGEKFIQKAFEYSTEEVQIGTSDYYFYLPKAMEATTYQAESDILGDAYLGSYTPTVDGLCSVTLYAIPESSLSYETEKELWADYDFTMVAEDQFNAWLEDGFTIEEASQYYTELFGDAVNDALDTTTDNGITVSLKEILVDYDGESYNEVSMLWINDGVIYEIYLSAPSETWPSLGEAFARGIHIK